MGTSLRLSDPRPNEPPERVPCLFGRSDLFAFLTHLADALTAMFGSACEVVIHDFTDLDSSIVHITGNVTGRRLGGTLTDLGLAILRQGQVPDALINYTTYAPDGHALTSTTVFIKDSNGSPLGSVCLNIDTNGLPLPGRFASPDNPNPTETFADTPEAITRNALNKLLAADGVADVRTLSRTQKVALIQKLDHAGVFFLRGAADIVAGLLGVTRSTVYLYLRASTANENKEET